MNVPKQARKEGKRLFRSCIVNGLLDEDRVRRVVARLLEARPRGFLPILVYLRRLIELEEQRKSVLIESAAPLEPSLQSGIRSSLERRYGSGLTFRFAQETGLLGGFRVRVGSDVFDASVWGRLNRMRQRFNSN